MKKILVIGIDALDLQTLIKLRQHLPVFSKLMADTPAIEFDGVFPPDSPTSWASIYTGLNPSRHGIVLFVDPLKRVSEMITKDVDDSSINGKTFWDIAGEYGKRVCIIPHLLGYPVWPVNGVMIGRSGVDQDVQMYPGELSNRFNLSQFKWELNLFPGRNKDQYVKSVEYQLKRETAFVNEIMKKTEWDLFFVSFGELDPIQYSFWNYYDKTDPGYPGNNPYSNVIPKFYKIFDSIVGDLISSLSSETAIIVVSDHGIGSRPVQLININEILRRNNLLNLKNGHNINKYIKNPDQYNMVKIKKYILKVIDQNNLGNVAASVLRLFPKGKDWFISAEHIDWISSRAYVTDQSGIKNYPYGGIIISVNDCNEYEQIRDIIIRELLQIRDPITDEKIFNWVCKREMLYSGEYIDRYPDILFELRDNYGAGINVPAKLFDKSISHNIAPGCHKQHHATFLISGFRDRVLSKNNMTLMDVAPTVLDILEIYGEFEFDGESIFEE